MTDLGITTGDLEIFNGDLVLDRGLRTLVLVCLFSDARLPAGQTLPPGEWSRRGFWAEAAGTRFGSLLWTIFRSKATLENAEKARELAVDALVPIQDQGIAETVTVSAAFDHGVLCLEITVERGSATLWPQLWEAEIDSRISLLGSEVLIRSISG